jgi:membrane-bound lytic murein transglycosylase MltF
MLEDEDLMEMVNAGVYPMTVVDNHIVMAWKNFFPAMIVYENIALNEGGSIACAFRKNSPALQSAVNEFIQHELVNSKTFAFAKKRLSSGAYIKQSTSQKELEKFNSKIELFRRYSGKYDFDWLMIIAQAYQESGLNQNARSPVGAVGIMQVLPSTASAAPININDIEAIDNNIHAGVKYLRYISDQYFSDPQISTMNRHLFTFAAYNAGPNRIDRLRKRAAQQGLDPNQWFQNVEIVVARHVGRETTQYVGNIFKYYTAYERFLAMKEARETTKVTGAIEVDETKPQSFGKKLKRLFRH